MGNNAFIFQDIPQTGSFGRPHGVNNKALFDINPDLIFPLEYGEDTGLFIIGKQLENTGEIKSLEVAPKCHDLVQSSR
jgi:hypothetical protein